MTTTKVAARRARRIAADEAHAWARNLRLNNPHAKLTLSMLSLYVDGDGFCFVSIPTLADDTELSAQTVRSRLTWLEQVGAIARLPQWIDEYGRRNSDAKGRRTSDLIRLMIDDQDAIEAAATGEEPAVSREADPMPQTGSDPAPETAATTLTLRRPYDSAEGLISEPEPESPPKAPSGGESDRDQSEGLDEPEHFAPAWAAYPGHEVMATKRHLAVIEFRLLSPEKQLLCRAAVPLFAAKLLKHGRTKPPSFHLWIRAKGFEEFPNARLPEAAPERRWIEGDELAGLTIASRIASRSPPRPVRRDDGGEGLPTVKPPQPDLAAMARFAGADPEAWLQVDLGTPQFAAWRDRLALWLGGEVTPERVWLEPFDPAVHGLPAIHADFRLRKSKHVLRVPAPWPPHRDGTWSAEEGERA